MAKKGSSKDLSIKHEEHIADQYNGRRSPSSGASDTDLGDVRAKHDLFECKVKGGPGRPVTATILNQMEKIADEAIQGGREPVLALRFFAPDHMLADQQGWVDLIVRHIENDLDRGPDPYPPNCENQGRWRSN